MPSHARLRQVLTQALVASAVGASPFVIQKMLPEQTLNVVERFELNRALEDIQRSVEDGSGLEGLERTPLFDPDRGQD
jgi:hypothetical protein